MKAAIDKLVRKLAPLTHDMSQHNDITQTLSVSGSSDVTSSQPTGLKGVSHSLSNLVVATVVKAEHDLTLDQAIGPVGHVALNHLTGVYSGKDEEESTVQPLDVVVDEDGVEDLIPLPPPPSGRELPEGVVPDPTYDYVNQEQRYLDRRQLMTASMQKLYSSWIKKARMWDHAHMWIENSESVSSAIRHSDYPVGVPVLIEYNNLLGRNTDIDIPPAHLAGRQRKSMNHGLIVKYATVNQLHLTVILGSDKDIHRIVVLVPAPGQNYKERRKLSPATNETAAHKFARLAELHAAQLSESLGFNAHQRSQLEKQILLQLLTIEKNPGPPMETESMYDSSFSSTSGVDDLIFQLLGAPGVKSADIAKVIDESVKKDSSAAKLIEEYTQTTHPTAIPDIEDLAEPAAPGVYDDEVALEPEPWYVMFRDARGKLSHKLVDDGSVQNYLLYSMFTPDAPGGGTDVFEMLESFSQPVMDPASDEAATRRVEKHRKERLNESIRNSNPGEARPNIRTKRADIIKERKAARDLRLAIRAEKMKPVLARILRVNTWADLDEFIKCEPTVDEWLHVVNEREFTCEKTRHFAKTCADGLSICDAFDVDGAWFQPLTHSFAMFPKLANVPAVDFPRLIPLIRRKEWNALMHAINGNIVGNYQDVQIMDQLSIAGVSSSQTDSLMYTNTTDLTQVWAGYELWMQVKYTGTSASPTSSSCLYVWGIQIARQGSPVPTLPVGSGTALGATNVLEWHFNAEPATVGQYYPERHWRRGQKIILNPGDAIYLSGIPLQFAPIAWYTTLRLLTIEPNPGPKVLASEAARHNRLMHALNGNTELQNAMMQETLGNTTQIIATPAKQAEEKISPQSTLLKDLTQALGQVMRSGGQLISSYTTGREAIITNWSQYQRTRAGMFQNLGETTYSEFFEEYFSQCSGSPDGVAYINSLRYSMTAPISQANTRVIWSDVGAKLATAMATGELITQSQTIRINTTVVNGDAMQRAIMESRQKVEASVCGSFMAPLLKLFLYAMTQVPLVATESSHANAISKLVPGTYAQHAIWYPLSSLDTLVQPNLLCRMITKDDETQIRAGTYQQPIPILFTMDTWGKSCAIVPINSDVLNRPGLLVAWILAHLEYPWTSLSYNVDLVDESDGVIHAGNPVSPMSNNTRIPGPTVSVLLVLENVFRSTGDTIANIGSGPNTVQISYNANSFLPGSVSVDIAQAIDDDVASIFQFSQDLPQAIEYWDRMYGNEEDYMSALWVAADHSFVLSPRPLRSAQQANGYVTVGTRVPGWNINGMINITQASLDRIANASTHPLDMTVTTNLLDVQEQTKQCCIVGTFDSISASDKAWGIIKAVKPTNGTVVRNLSELAVRLREIARLQTCVMDHIMSTIGLPMEEMLAPTQYLANYSVTNEVQLLWNKAYKVLQEAVINVVIDNPTVKYRGFACGNLNKTYYPTLIAIVGAAVIPWARVPYWYPVRAGLDKYTGPQGAFTTPTEWRTGMGYPNNGNPYDIMVKCPMSRESPEAEPFMRYWSLATISPVNRNTLQLAICTDNGSGIWQILVPCFYPTMGAALQYVLQNYNIPNGSNAQYVDYPLMPLPPKRVARDGQNKLPMFYGTDAGVIARYKSPNYFLRMMSFSDQNTISSILSSGYKPNTVDALKYLGLEVDSQTVGF